jgi:hypothetical protein
VIVRDCAFTNITFGRAVTYSGGAACYLGDDTNDANVTWCEVVNNSFTQFKGRQEGAGIGSEITYSAIRLYGAVNDKVANNRISNLVAINTDLYGIRVDASRQIEITNNSIENLQTQVGVANGNPFGIIIAFNAGSSRVRDNLIRNLTSPAPGTSCGILVYGGLNMLSGNLIMGGVVSAFDNTGNLWYEGRFFAPMGRYQSVGNYYWNYNIVANDTNHDHIADQPYNLSKALDLYPIMFSGLDSDSDGLFNGEETTLGTDINIADTDGDGWSDYDEVRVYGTNPLDRDTDGDGIIDSQDPQPRVPTQTPAPDYTAAIQNAASMVIAGLIILAGAIIVFGIMNAKRASTRKDIPSDAVPAKR